MTVRDARQARLRWRSRRGMKELDVLLARWLEEEWPRADEDGRRCFESLLDEPDPDLAGWLIGAVRPADPARAALVDAIVRRHR